MTPDRNYSQYGFINTAGELVIGCEWDNAYSFENGLSRVEKDGRIMYIDLSGQIVYLES